MMCPARLVLLGRHRRSPLGLSLGCPRPYTTAMRKVRRQRRFPTGAWMTYKATITQLLRQSITHLIRTVQYIYGTVLHFGLIVL